MFPFLPVGPDLTRYRQLGNLLVLSAASADPTLRYLVSETLLRELFAWVIGFLRTVAHPTSGLRSVLHILESLERKLGETRGLFDSAKPDTYRWMKGVTAA
jgi:hypothetical protein